jgi:hypothetical protein
MLCAIHERPAADQQKQAWRPQGTVDSIWTMSDNQLLETQGPEARGEYPDLELYDNLPCKYDFDLLFMIYDARKQC